MSTTKKNPLKVKIKQLEKIENERKALEAKIASFKSELYNDEYRQVLIKEWNDKGFVVGAKVKCVDLIARRIANIRVFYKGEAITKDHSGYSSLTNNEWLKDNDYLIAVDMSGHSTPIQKISLWKGYNKGDWVLNTATLEVFKLNDEMDERPNIRPASDKEIKDFLLKRATIQGYTVGAKVHITGTKVNGIIENVKVFSRQDELMAGFKSGHAIHWHAQYDYMVLLSIKDFSSHCRFVAIAYPAGNDTVHVYKSFRAGEWVYNQNTYRVFKLEQDHESYELKHATTPQIIQALEDSAKEKGFKYEVKFKVIDRPDIYTVVSLHPFIKGVNIAGTVFAGVAKSYADKDGYITKDIVILHVKDSEKYWKCFVLDDSLRIVVNVEVNGYSGVPSKGHVKFGCAWISNAQIRAALALCEATPCESHSRIIGDIKIGVGRFTHQNLKDLSNILID